MPQHQRRLTQRDIARLAGVSQTTVSLVLNGSTVVRIAPDTRERVLQTIRKTGYVADPLARRLQQRSNQIFGVFTYESVFPSASADFYHPFLEGIEEAAEQAGCDLLLFTSAPATDGRRRIFHENNRLRLADGCILLGREIPHEELARLVAEGYPFVSVGRRDDAGGPVPFVGADYASATGGLVERAYALGHRRFAYVGPGEGAESAVDRYRGFASATKSLGATARHVREPGPGHGALLDALLARRITAVFVEDYAVGVALVTAAEQRQLRAPGDLSVVALGDPTRPVDVHPDLTSFQIPRREMGAQSLEVLTALLQGGTEMARQRLLPCALVEGSTLAAQKG